MAALIRYTRPWMLVVIVPVWIAIMWLNGECSGDSSSNCEFVDGYGFICEEEPRERERPY